MDGKWRKDLRTEALVIKDWPLEKGVSYNWTVRVVKAESCGRGGPSLSVSVITKKDLSTTWPCWGAVHNGWALAFWQSWGKSVFSHNRLPVKDLPYHFVRSGDVIEVTLSEFGDLSFILNGTDMGTYPDQLPWNETLYPAVFSNTNGGIVVVELEVMSAVNIKPAKRN